MSTTLGIRVLAVLMGLLTSILVARSLGPEGRGLFAVALTLAGLGVQLGNFGLHASNTYYLAQSPTLLAPLMGNSAVAAWAIGGGGALLIWLVLTLCPDLAPLPNPLLALAFLWVPIGLLNLYNLNLLLASGDVRSFNRLELAAKILTFALVGGVVLTGVASTEGLILASVSALSLTTLWGWNKLKRQLSSPPSWNGTLFRLHLPYGMKAYAVALLSYAALKSDLLLVHHLSGAEGAGLYAIVTSLSEFVLMVPATTGALLFPKLAALQNPQATWQGTRRALFGVGSVLLLLLASLALCRAELIHLFFGLPYVPASQAFLWHLPGLFCLGLEIILAQYLAATGMPWPITLVWSFAWILNLGLNVGLIPALGYTGASLAFSLTQFVVLLGIGSLAFQQRKKDRSHG